MSELTNALITYDNIIAKTNIDVLRKIAKTYGYTILIKVTIILIFGVLDVMLLIPNTLMIFF